MALEAPPAPSSAAPIAPAAPAPAPAARPSAPPPAKPASRSAPPQPVSKPAKDLNDAFAQLDKMGEAQPPPTRGQDGKFQGQKADLQEPTEKTEKTEADDPNAQPPPAANPPAAAKPGEAGKAPSSFKELRGQYDAVKAENAQLQEKLKSFEQAKPAGEDPERKKLADTLTERDKELNELRDEMRFTSYERSQEYKDKWLAPFMQAYDAGRARVAGLKLTDENGNARQGTAEDFDALMQITDSDLAADRAAELFGNKASMVMYHREKAMELNSARVNALEDFRKHGAERERVRRDQLTESGKKITTEATALWQKHRSAPHEKHPLFFKPIEGDTEGNKLLEDGFKEADEAFSNMNPLDPRLSADQRETVLKRHATVYNKAAAFNRVAYLLKQERSLRMAMEKKLKDFENSEPGAGEGRGGGKGPVDTWGKVEADLNKYVGR